MKIILDVKAEKLKPFLMMLKKLGFLGAKGIQEIEGIEPSKVDKIFSGGEQLVNTEEVIHSIQNYFAKADLPVEKVWLFGSYARNEQTLFSDIDLMIRFQPGSKIDLWDFAGIMQDLESILGCRVDLVREGGAKSFAISNIEKDKSLIYEKKATGQRTVWNSKETKLDSLIEEVQKIIKDEGL